MASHRKQPTGRHRAARETLESFSGHLHRPEGIVSHRRPRETPLWWVTMQQAALATVVMLDLVLSFALAIQRNPGAILPAGSLLIAYGLYRCRRYWGVHR